MPVYLSIKKPYIVPADQYDHTYVSPAGRAKLEAEGYDGIIAPAVEGGRFGEIVVFRPEQIKSAIGNSGKFDPNSPSLTDPIADFAKNISAGLKTLRAELDAAAPVNQGGALRSVATDTKPPEAAAPDAAGLSMDSGRAAPGGPVPAAPEGATAGRGATPQAAALAARISDAQARHPDLMVMLDGMPEPMRMSDFLASVQREADDEIAGAPDLMDAATCALLNGGV
jgi:hypothetical protein